MNLFSLVSSKYCCFELFTSYTTFNSTNRIKN